MQDERNLVWELRNKGFTVMRAHASNSSIKIARFDIIAGKKIKGL